jgi:hypothetical protein
MERKSSIMESAISFFFTIRDFLVFRSTIMGQFYLAQRQTYKILFIIRSFSSSYLYYHL